METIERGKWMVLAVIVGMGLIVCHPLAAGAMTVLGEKDEAGKKAIVREFAALCGDPAKRGKDCETLRQKAVPILKDDLLILGSSADRIYLTILVKALKSPEAELRAAAADAIGMIGATSAEFRALASSLNDPVPAVRRSVSAALNIPNEPSARLLAKRSQKYRSESLDPDPLPKPSAIGAPAYPNAKYLYFGSNLATGHAAFVTDDPTGKVVDFYRAQANRAALTAEQFVKAYPPRSEKSMDQETKMRMAMEFQQKMMQAMQEGKSPEQAMGEVMKMGSFMDAPKLIKDYADPEIYGAAQFIILEEDEMAGMKNPVKFVAVFEDRSLGKTGFVIHFPPAMPPISTPQSSPRPPKRR